MSSRIKKARCNHGGSKQVKLQIAEATTGAYSHLMA